MNVEQAIAKTSARLRLAGIERARREARLLVATALKAEPLDLIAQSAQALTARERTRLADALNRRLAGEPANRIRGQREFWSLDFRLTPAVLNPRPDTELLVEQGLAFAADRRQEALRVLDLGTGSGCILLALLTELPRALGVGMDRSAGALAIAQANAAALGLGKRALWFGGDWLAAVDGWFDLVVANPPYIPSGQLAGLAPGVRGFDPMMALDGGPDGLAAYRAIMPGLARVLAPGGKALFECGQGQAGNVAALGQRMGFHGTIWRDLARIERVVGFSRKSRDLQNRQSAVDWSSVG